MNFEVQRQKAARGPAAALHVTAVSTDDVAHWPVIFASKKDRCTATGMQGHSENPM